MGETHKIIMSIGLLCLKVVAKRKDDLFQLLDALLGIKLVLVSGIKFRSCLVLSLLLDGDSLLQDFVLVQDSVVFSLEVVEGCLHLVLISLE